MTTVLQMKLRLEGWASPAKGYTLDALVQDLREQGFKILDIEPENNRVKVIDERG